MVIIIGVAVLALGLTWVRGTFTQVGGITETALENAETIFGEVAFSGKISAPAAINLESTDVKKFRVLVRNTDEIGGPSAYSITATRADGSNSCITVVDDVVSVSIPVQDIAEVGGGVITDNCPSTATGIINVNILKGTDGYASDSIAIRIK